MAGPWADLRLLLRAFLRLLVARIAALPRRGPVLGPPLVARPGPPFRPPPRFPVGGAARAARILVS